MKSTFISKEKNVVKFTMEFTAEEFENAQIKAYQATKGRFAIDGFRKGKAPRKLIEAQFGEDIFFEDAINSMFAETYPAALDELELDVIDRPSASFSELKKGEGFTITLEVQVYPEVEVKNYKGVEIDKVEGTVTDEDMEKEMELLRKRNARMVLVDRPVKEGDTALIDYAGFVGDDQFEGGTAERYALKIGSGQFIPGFEEQLVGVSAGEEKDVVVTFPEEYHAPELAGKEAVFKCKVHEVKEEELPVLDDDFAKDISEFDTLEEFKADRRAEMEKAAAARAESEMKNAVLEKVVEGNDIDVPEVMVEDEAMNMIQEFDQQLRYQGMSVEQYLGFIQKTIDDFKEEMKPEALKRVKMRMIVYAVAKAENIKASQEDIDKELELMAMQYKLDAAQVREMLGADNLKALERDIELRGAIDFMYNNAKIK